MTCLYALPSRRCGLMSSTYKSNSCWIVSPRNNAFKPDRYIDHGRQAPSPMARSELQHTLLMLLMLLMLLLHNAGMHVKINKKCA